MNIIKKLSLFSFSLFTLCQAHIYKAEKWVNQSTGQEIALLGDYHFADKEQNQVNLIQQNAIVDRAKTLDATIIVEDGCFSEEIYSNPLHYDHNKYRKLTMENPNKTTLLHAFTGRCHKEGMKVHNVEFRLPPLATSSKLLMAKIEQAKTQVEQYNDAPQCNAYYKRKLEELRMNVEIPCQELFDTLKQSTANVQDACETIRYKPAYDKVLEYFWGTDDFDGIYDKINHIIIGYQARLLDLKILHAIAQVPGHSIVCAGSNHIKRVKPALAEMGFTGTHSQGTEYLDDNREPDALDMAQTLGAFYTADNAIIKQQPTTNYFMIYIAIIFCILALIGIASAVWRNRRQIIH